MGRGEAERVKLPVAVLTEDGGVGAAEDGGRGGIACVAEQGSGVFGEERVRGVDLPVASEAELGRIGPAVEHRRLRPAEIAPPAEFSPFRAFFQFSHFYPEPFSSFANLKSIDFV